MRARYEAAVQLESESKHKEAAAAFAALVANDLLAPGMFDAGLWPAAIPFIAGLAVVLVALRTKSLLWSAVTGVVAYALLLLI